jgi:hypothetical protein
MKRVLISLILVLGLVCTTLQAQNLSTTRLEKQHGPSSHQKSRVKQTEATLLLSLDSTWHGDQRSALNSVRYLEQLFPSYEFALLIKPIGRILKDEASDPVARRLAALALDELHSEAGDAVIDEVATACDDKGLQTLCQALQGGREYWKSLSSSK